VALAPGDWLLPSSIEEKATTMVEAVAAVSELVASSPSSVSTPGVEAQAQQIDSAAPPSKLEEQAETTMTAATTPALAVPSSPSTAIRFGLGMDGSPAAAATNVATTVYIDRPHPGHRLSASSTEKASTTRDPTSMSSTAGSHPRWLPLRAPPAGSICCDSRHNFQRLGSICYGRGCTFRIPCNCDAAFVSSVRPRDQAKGWAYGGLPFFPLGPQQFT
jgi:hypothetical protein